MSFLSRSFTRSNAKATAKSPFSRSLRLEPLEDRRLLSLTVLEQTFQTVDYTYSGVYQGTANYLTYFKTTSGGTVSASGTITYTDALHGTGTITVSATDTTNPGKPYNILTNYPGTFTDNNGAIKASIIITETGTLNTATQGNFTIAGTGSGTFIYTYDAAGHTVPLTVKGTSSGNVVTDAPDLTVTGASWLADGGVEFTFTNSGLIATTNRATAVSNVKLYWATGTTVDTIICSASSESAAVYWNQATGKAQLSYVDFDLDKVPAKDAYLLIVADSDGTVTESDENNNVFALEYNDITPPVITISAPSSAATASSSVTYAITYTDPNFSASTLSLANITLNTTGDANGTVSLSGSDKFYTVTITDITGNGTLGIAIAADTASDTLGHSSLATSSSAFTVDNTAPTVTVNKAKTQADPTDAATVNFTVVFSETVTDFNASKVTLSGTAGGTRAVKVTGSGTTYNVAVSGITSSGTIVANIAAGAVHDAVGNANAASTSTDNVITSTISPVISKLAVTATTAAAKTSISWSQSDSHGLGATTISIAGKAVSIAKKTTSKTSANFSYAAVWKAGTYSYTITAVDAKGYKTVYTGKFTIKATTPTLSNIKATASTSDKPTTISWKVYDIDGVASSALKIDDKTVTSGITKSGSGTTITYTYKGYLAAGSHSYQIAGTDAAAATATSGKYWLTVKATTPTIKSIKATAATSADKATITWTVYDYDRVASSTLKIDGKKITSGITQSGSGTTVTYTYKGYATAGKHIYTIDALDAAVPASSAKQVSGSFTVKATTPTITGISGSSVEVAAATSAKPSTIKWKAYDIDGIKSSVLKIDGKVVDASKVTVTVLATSGTLTTSATYVYSGVLTLGKHSYAITVVDKANVSKAVSGSLTVQPSVPTVSDPALTTIDGVTTVVWTVQDSQEGIASASVWINGQAVSVTKRIVSQSGTIVKIATFTYAGKIANGTSYKITATDAKAASTTKSGVFEIV